MTQGSRPRTQNNPRPRTDPLEAKDRNARGQGLRTQRASVFQKKSLLKFTARSLARSPRRRKKKGHDLGLFFTNHKIVLFSTANRAFSSNCRLGGQGQGLYYRGQGLQNVFLRTVSRTPPLKNSNDIRDKINIFLPKSQKNLYYYCLSHFAIEWDVFKQNHIDHRLYKHFEVFLPNFGNDTLFH